MIVFSIFVYYIVIWFIVDVVGMVSIPFYVGLVFYDGWLCVFFICMVYLWVLYYGLLYDTVLGH